MESGDEDTNSLADGARRAWDWITGNDDETDETESEPVVDAVASDDGTESVREMIGNLSDTVEAIPVVGPVFEVLEDTAKSIAEPVVDMVQSVTDDTEAERHGPRGLNRHFRGQSKRDDWQVKEALRTDDEDLDGVSTDMEQIARAMYGRRNDDDFDGLTNAAEARLGTDPDNRDTDGDKIPDLIELRLGTDPLVPDAMPDRMKDPDRDLASDGTDEGEMIVAMFKVEGITRNQIDAERAADDAERAANGDREDADQAVGQEVDEDLGKDSMASESGLNDSAVVEVPEDLETDVFDRMPEVQASKVLRADDFDGVTNDMDSMAHEIVVAEVDTDFDGLTDAAEANLGTDPSNRDTDGDKIPDLIEVRLGSDPLEPNAMPDGMMGEGLSSDGSDQGDLREAAAKVRGIAQDQRAAADAAAGIEQVVEPAVGDDLIDPDFVITDPALVDVMASLEQSDNISAQQSEPEPVVEDPVVESEEPIEDTFQQIDDSIGDLAIEPDDFNEE